MKMPSHSLPLYAILLLCFFAASCGNAGRVTYDSPQEAFGKGRAYFEEKKFTDAVPYFQGVFSFGRTHQWAADAQLYLARAYKENREYILAASEYDRFIQIYRSDSRIPLATYERALTYYERSPEYKLDQTDTKKAIEQFQLFMERYPADSLVDDSQRRIVELRSKLAQKQHEIGKLYETRELFEAAALSYEAVFDDYSDTPWAEAALVDAIYAYIQYSDQSIRARQRIRLESALKNYDRLVQIFPDSEHLDRAEELHDMIQERIAILEAPVEAPIPDAESEETEGNR